MKGEALLDEFRRLTGATNVSLLDDVQAAYQDLLKRAGRWHSRHRDTVSLVFKSGESSYALPLHKMTRLEGIAIRENTDQREWRPLPIVDDAEFDSERLRWLKSDGTNDTDRPRVGRISGGDTRVLEVTPGPDGTYEGRLTYVGFPALLTRENEPILPEMYHLEIAQLGAAYWLMNSQDENTRARGHILERRVLKNAIPRAIDTSPNLSNGVKTRSARMMRC